MDTLSIALTPVPLEVVVVNGYLGLVVDPEDVLNNDDAPDILADMLKKLGAPGRCLFTPDAVFNLAKRAHEYDITAKICLTTELVKVRS